MARYFTESILRMLLITPIISAVIGIAPLIAGEPQPMVGEPAPAFNLKGLDGNWYSLAGLSGRYTVIHFATTWCPFCNAEAPHLEDLYERYRERGVEVLVIDVKEDEQRVARWAAHYDFSFPVLLDESGAVAAQFAPEGVHPALARDEVPLASNLIIDRGGKIRYYSLLNTAGFDPALTELKNILDQLLHTDTIQ